MAERLRARRLTDEEGRRLQQVVRRGKRGSTRVRRAVIIMASASGTPAPAIARLVTADQDTVRDVIHAFNEQGLDCLDPKWAGGGPRRITRASAAKQVTTRTARTGSTSAWLRAASPMAVVASIRSFRTYHYVSLPSHHWNRPARAASGTSVPV